MNAVRDTKDDLMADLFPKMLNFRNSSSNLEIKITISTDDENSFELLNFNTSSTSKKLFPVDEKKGFSISDTAFMIDDSWVIVRKFDTDTFPIKKIERFTFKSKTSNSSEHQLGFLMGVRKTALARIRFTFLTHEIITSERFLHHNE